VSLYTMIDRPELESPVVIVALDGWIDAGMAAAATMRHLLASTEAVTVASFDTDDLLDHRARRPTMQLLDGRTTGLEWPHLELRAGADAVGNDVLFLVGAEPDHRWRAFAAAVVDLALNFGARMVVDLGAYPAPVAHTRPVRVVSTATTSELADLVGFVPGSIEVPAGVGAAIERRCAEVGLPAVGLWAQVPHYAAAIPQPAASLAHLDAIRRVAGLEFAPGDLATQALSTAEHITALVAGNTDHEAMVRELERRHDAEVDSAGAQGGVPFVDEDLDDLGDDLVAEVEQFLRGESD
jgi:proteasome assembly chaperone (PAC2) family protein